MKFVTACVAGALSLSCACATAAPMVLAYYAGNPGNYASLTRYAGQYDAVALDLYNITRSGVVTGDDTPSDALSFLKSRGIPAYGCVSNFDTDWNPAIGHDVTYKNAAQAIRNIVAFAKRNELTGVNVDFEALDQGDRNHFSSFVEALGRELHADGFKLIVSVPAFSSRDATNPANYAYDLRALGAAVDYLQIMTYDETIPGWAPGPVAGSDWIENNLDFAVSEVPRGKILSGIPAYGYDWRLADNSGGPLAWAGTDALVRTYGVKPAYVVSNQSVTFDYTANDDSGAHTVWTENPRSVALKAGLVNAYGLGGTSMYALGMEDARFWKALRTGLGQ